MQPIIFCKGHWLVPNYPSLSPPLSQLQVEEKQKAEEICALVSQSFQLVYTEATMDFFDRQIRDGAGTSVSSSFSLSPGGHASATNSLNSNHIVYDPSDPSDISLSNFDVNR